MSGILNIGTRALLANQVALQTAGNNIANVNTPGYSRQSVVLQNVAGQSTGSGYVGLADSPLLGVHEGRAVYLLYNGILKDMSVGGGNVLNGPVFAVLPQFDGAKVIYAAANRMGARTQRENITFKQTPYALEV